MRSYLRLLFVSLVFTSFFSATAHSLDPKYLEVSIESIYGRNPLPDNVVNWRGSLREYVERDFSEFGMSSILLNYTVNNDPWKRFTSAENIAAYAWNKLTRGAVVEEQIPCGRNYFGRIDLTSPEGNPKTSFQIKGSGDGVQNTCTGAQGWLYWSFDVIVTFNPENQSGTIRFRSYQE